MDALPGQRLYEGLNQGLECRGSFFEPIHAVREPPEGVRTAKHLNLGHGVALAES